MREGTYSIGAVRAIATVTHAQLQTGTDMGGRIVITTNLTGARTHIFPKQLFELIAENLRPKDEWRKREADYDDGHRVVKYLKGKWIRMRREIQYHPTLGHLWIDSIEGMANDDDIAQRLRKVDSREVSEHTASTNQRHNRAYKRRSRARSGSR